MSERAWPSPPRVMVMRTRAQRTRIHALLGLVALLAARQAGAGDPPAGPPEASTEAISDPQYQSVVTATRSEEPLADTPVATEVITRDEIAASGAENVAEVLDERPGVEIVRSFAGANIYLQGLDPEYMLVLVDGQRVIGRVNGAVDLARIPVDDIERIEIVRGASSALYGSDAIGGVINIITRRAGEPLEADVSLAYGSFNATDLRTHAGMQRGRWNASLTAGWHRSDAFDIDPFEPSTNGSAFDELEVGGRLQYHIPDWRRAVAEVHRVLRPGGRFYAEEVFAKLILSPICRRLLAHPIEDRFDHDQFRRGLQEAGFQVRASKQLWGEYGWFIAEKSVSA